MPESTSDRQKRFLSLFLASQREVYRYVAAMVPCVADAQDIVQQTAEALWEKFSEYDPARPFTAWACRFARYEVLRWLERHGRWQRLLANGLAEELAARREATATEREERLRYLEACLAKLPGDQRELVTGYYYRREAIEPLAARAGRSVEAVYKALQRTRQALLECIRRASAQEGGAA